MAAESELSVLRDRIRKVDEGVLDLVAERLRLAREVGKLKDAAGLPVKNYEVEKSVVERARQQAVAVGVPDDLAVELARLLIESACRVQEEGRRGVKARPGTRRRIAVVGGLGRMGTWLARYFESFGHHVRLQDRAAVPTGCPFPVVGRLDEVWDTDVVVLATPISATPALLDAVAASKTRALVFDVCSLKSPLLDSLERAAKAGVRITSVHPMFGPGADRLAGRNVVFCEVGIAEPLEEAMELFRESAASLIKVPLARHDELMGQVLGLSHLTSLVFAETLARAGITLEELRAVASTTFAAQTAVTEAVVGENPDLYYEIQRANAFTARVLERFQGALASYSRAALDDNATGFKGLMARGRKFFDGGKT